MTTPKTPVNAFFLISLAILLIAPATAAQDAPFLQNTFNIKKGTEVLTAQKVNSYLTQVFDLSSPDENGTFSGSIKDMYYTRNGKYKFVYSIDYSIKPSIQAGKATLEYKINDINRRVIICDRTQQEITDNLSPDKISSELGGFITESFTNLTECIRTYIKTGEKNVPKLSQRAYWYQLNYIVEPSSVSYYTVLTSEKGLSKEEIYKIFENYFTYAYRSGKAVIENKNPEECTIIAKGKYPDIHHYYGWGTEDYTVPHIVSIQCRDGRARVTFTVSNYDIFRHGSKYVPSGNFTRNIVEYEPFGAEKDEEMVECLKKVEILILAQFLDMKKAMEEGNTAVDTLDDW